MRNEWEISVIDIIYVHKLLKINYCALDGTIFIVYYWFYENESFNFIKLKRQQLEFLQYRQ